MPAAPARPESFKPGDVAPVSGTYRVTHGDPHRAAHELTLRQGEVFPPCRHCGQEVRFRLISPGEENVHLH